MGGDATVYSSRPSLGASMKSVEISDVNKLTARLSKKVTADELEGKVSVTDADGKAVDVKNIKTDGTKVIITTAKILTCEQVHRRSQGLRFAGRHCGLGGAYGCLRQEVRL